MEEIKSKWKLINKIKLGTHVEIQWSRLGNFASCERKLQFETHVNIASVHKAAVRLKGTNSNIYEAQIWPHEHNCTFKDTEKKKSVGQQL
jgi:hypothetical protein